MYTQCPIKLVRAMAGWLLAEFLPNAVDHKRAHTQSKTREHVAKVEAMRKDGVLAPSLTLRPGVTVELSHSERVCSAKIVI